MSYKHKNNYKTDKPGVGWFANYRTIGELKSILSNQRKVYEGWDFVGLLRTSLDPRLELRILVPEKSYTDYVETMAQYVDTNKKSIKQAKILAIPPSESNKVDYLVATGNTDWETALRYAVSEERYKLLIRRDPSLPNNISYNLIHFCFTWLKAEKYSKICSRRDEILQTFSATKPLSLHEILKELEETSGHKGI